MPLGNWFKRPDFDDAMSNSTGRLRNQFYRMLKVVRLNDSKPCDR